MEKKTFVYPTLKEEASLAEVTLFRGSPIYGSGQTALDARLSVGLARFAFPSHP